jgi:YggT family protein
MYGTLVNIVQSLFTAYWYVLLATAIISWIPELSDTTVGRLLHRVSEPYLRLFRRWVPSLRLGQIELDLSYIVAVIVFFLVQSEIVKVMYGLLGSINP